ncbi:sensor histidine kinase [Amycolatopsis sp. RTGN1]|uniref:sensor histidine kinase n=1 Tax=Amycolatopsis ponsaeliensis TaxID=2992142 RepID=UPI00254F5405|nr:sensor histidine kinase [Amycolatopsis sp. RTGN1]
MDTPRRTPTAASAAFGFVAAGVSVQLITLGITTALWFGLHLTDVKFARDVVLGGVVFTALVLLAVSPVLTAVQRNRLRAVLGMDIPPDTARRWTWRGLAATGRQFGYHAVVAPVLAAYALLAAIAWTAGVVLAGIVAYLLVLPAVSLLRTTGDARHAALGAVRPVLAAGSRTAGLVAQLDVWAADALLGPNRLHRRLVDLAESRAGVVDAADAERRRIERDLHDGAQQRLVSLAMNLGLARAGLPDLPDEAKQVIVDAHEEAKEALAELRTLVRGLHPAILDDRGLDAALSGIAARAPVPVRLRVDMAARASPTVEAVAYFMVAEALANIAKHAHASCAGIEVRRLEDVLTVIVTDDGVGGADPSRGTGLTGLAHRVRSVDGILSVSSPAGGPTSVTAELPCAS